MAALGLSPGLPICLHQRFSVWFHILITRSPCNRAWASSPHSLMYSSCRVMVPCSQGEGRFLGRHPLQTQRDCLETQSCSQPPCLPLELSPFLQPTCLLPLRPPSSITCHPSMAQNPLSISTLWHRRDPHPERPLICLLAPCPFHTLGSL